MARRLLDGLRDRRGRPLAKRRTRSSRRPSNGTTASMTSSLAEAVEIDVGLVLGAPVGDVGGSRSAGSSIAAILLANTALTAASGPITAILAVGRAIVAIGSNAGPHIAYKPGAVRLADDHGDLRHGGLGDGGDHLRPVADDAPRSTLVPIMNPGTSARKSSGML